MLNLVLQLGVEILAGDEDGDDPEQEDEENVEGAEEKIEPTDGRHPAVVLRAGHQVVRHHNLPPETQPSHPASQQFVLYLIWLRWVVRVVWRGLVVIRQGRGVILRVSVVTTVRRRPPTAPFIRARPTPRTALAVVRVKVPIVVETVVDTVALLAVVAVAVIVTKALSTTVVVVVVAGEAMVETVVVVAAETTVLRLCLAGAAVAHAYCGATVSLCHNTKSVSVL